MRFHLPRLHAFGTFVVPRMGIMRCHGPRTFWRLPRTAWRIGAQLALRRIDDLAYHPAVSLVFAGMTRPQRDERRHEVHVGVDGRVGSASPALALLAGQAVPPGPSAVTSLSACDKPAYLICHPSDQPSALTTIYSPGSSRRRRDRTDSTPRVAPSAHAISPRTLLEMVNAGEKLFRLNQQNARGNQSDRPIGGMRTDRAGDCHAECYGRAPREGPGLYTRSLLRASRSLLGERAAAIERLETELGRAGKRVALRRRGSPRVAALQIPCESHELVEVPPSRVRQPKANGSRELSREGLFVTDYPSTNPAGFTPGKAFAFPRGRQAASDALHGDAQRDDCAPLWSPSGFRVATERTAALSQQ
mgnify:CR=1 FL=1